MRLHHRWTALLTFGAVAATSAACVIRVSDDDDDWLNHDPEIVEAEAWCDDDLRYWTLRALVDDADGLADVEAVEVDAFQVYPDKSEDYLGYFGLYDEGDGWWSAEVDSDPGLLDCESNSTFCFDFRAYDEWGGQSDVYDYCN